jgi:hypothetical protein
MISPHFWYTCYLIPFVFIAVAFLTLCRYSDKKKKQQNCMNIKTANLRQAKEIHRLLQVCGQHIRENGIMQWNDNYPLLSAR